ncbi:hypothetical protein [Phreatobacter sp.]|uniref:hypothetical protein n=1 Tax=Phreatobacter sp. TaxID=1966341 RepID=UPI003F71AB56
MFYWFLPGFSRASADLAAYSAATAMAATVTVTQRMALLSDPSLLAAASGRAEAARMVSEKMEAAAEGVFAASVEAGLFMMRASMGRISPDDVARGLVAISSAATRPAARRVRANARRLTRG